MSELEIKTGIDIYYEVRESDKPRYSVASPKAASKRWVSVSSLEKRLNDAIIKAAAQHIKESNQEIPSTPNLMFIEGEEHVLNRLLKELEAGKK